VSRLAIVISAVGSVESLESTLVSVLENRPADCEIVVVLNRPYADPYDLAAEVRFIQPAGSTVAGINRGLASTQAPFVHLLASGCLVSEGWADAALARFGDRRVASVVPLVWDADHDDRIVAAGVGYYRSGRRYLVGAGQSALDPNAQPSIIGPCGIAAFYRKSAVDLAGGLSTRLDPRQADVDLALVLKQAGFSVAFEPKSSVRALAEADPEVGGFRQALCDERLFRRNLIGPAKSGAILAHWCRVGLEVAGNIGRLRMFSLMAGRLVGCCEWGGHGRHHRAMTALSDRSVRAPAPGERVRIDGSHDAPARKDAGRSRAQAR